MKNPITILVALLLLSFPLQQINAQKTQGNGRVTTETRSVGSFHSINIEGACDLIISSGNSSRIKLETDENLHDLVKTEVSNGYLTVSDDNKIKKSTRMRLYVSMEELRSLHISGASSITCEDQLSADEMNVHVSGAADGNLKVDASCLKVQCSGAANLTLSGRSGCAKYQISGAGEIKGFNLRTDDVEMRVSGTGNAELAVSESLEVEVSGMANIKYKGSPEVTRNMRGMGSIKRVD